MDAYEHEIKDLTENLTPRELAERVLIFQRLAHTYHVDNDNLRKENESLKYLIAKYNMDGKEQ